MDILIWIQTQDSTFPNPYTKGDVQQIKKSGSNWGEMLTSQFFQLLKTDVLPQSLVDALVYEPIYKTVPPTRRKFRVNVDALGMTGGDAVTVPIAQFMSSLIQIF